MSKKIMKRSLALGALMAFVITGSVWAKDFPAGTDISSFANNVKYDDIIVTSNTSGQQAVLSGASTDNSVFYFKAENSIVLKASKDGDYLNGGFVLMPIHQIILLM